MVGRRNHGEAVGKVIQSTPANCIRVRTAQSYAFSEFMHFARELLSAILYRELPSYMHFVRICIFWQMQLAGVDCSICQKCWSSV